MMGTQEPGFILLSLTPSHPNTTNLEILLCEMGITMPALSVHISLGSWLYRSKGWQGSVFSLWLLSSNPSQGRSPVACPSTSVSLHTCLASPLGPSLREQSYVWTRLSGRSDRPYTHRLGCDALSG